MLFRSGGGVVAARVEAQGAGGRPQQAGRLVVGAGGGAGRGPGGLRRLWLRQGRQAAVRVPGQVGKGGGGVGRLAVGQRRLRVGRREVRRLEVGGGGRVAQRRRRPVGGLGQRGQAGSASRCAQTVGALLGKERGASGDPAAAERTLLSSRGAGCRPARSRGPRSISERPVGAGTLGWGQRCPVCTVLRGRSRCGPLHPRFRWSRSLGTEGPAPRLPDPRPCTPPCPRLLTMAE